MDPVTLTNTEKLALAQILAEEQAAVQRSALMRKAFDDDLRCRLRVGPIGFLRIDVAAGTVQHVMPGDAVPN